MKMEGIQNGQILKLVGSLGHTDRFAVSDLGLPTPAGVERIDLAIAKGIPSFIQVFRSIMEELAIEKVVLAREIKDKNPGIYSEIVKICGNISIELIDHTEFKASTRDVKAIIRTGEATPYANVILQAGVNFPV